MGQRRKPKFVPASGAEGSVPRRKPGSLSYRPSRKMDPRRKPKGCQPVEPEGTACGASLAQSSGNEPKGFNSMRSEITTKGYA